MDEETKQRFEAVDQRFEAVDQRFDAIDQRFDAMDQRFDRLDNRLAEIERRFDAMGADFADMKHMFRVTTEYIEDLTRRVSEGVLMNTERSETVEETVARMEAEIAKHDTRIAFLESERRKRR